MMQAKAAPWLSPQVVTVNSFPNYGASATDLAKTS